jgi:hypothetical protein
MEPQKHFRFLQKKIAASIKSDDCQRTAGEQVVHPPVARRAGFENRGFI